MNANDVGDVALDDKDFTALRNQRSSLYVPHSRDDSPTPNTQRISFTPYHPFASKQQHLTSEQAKAVGIVGCRGGPVGKDANNAYILRQHMQQLVHIALALGNIGDALIVVPAVRLIR